MAKYLVMASYTAEGAKGLMKDGGTKRRQAAEQAIKSAGGKLEAFYFAFGASDVYVLIDVPDAAAAAAVAMTTTASGAVRVNTTVLITPEEMDEVRNKTVEYRPPGA